MATRGGWIQNDREAMVLAVHAELTRLRERVRVLEAELAAAAEALLAMEKRAIRAEVELDIERQRVMVWREAGRLSTRSTHYWRDRATKAEVEVARLRDENETLHRQWRELKEAMGHDD